MTKAAKNFRKYQVIVCWGEGMKYILGKGHASLKAARHHAQSAHREALRKYKSGARPFVVIAQQMMTFDAERIN
jgi:hypothetical protein